MKSIKWNNSQPGLTQTQGNHIARLTEPAMPGRSQSGIHSESAISPKRPLLGRGTPLLASSLLSVVGLIAQSQVPLIRSGAGADGTAIQAVVDQFRADLGTRKEITWDGVPDNLAAPNFLPGDF